MMKRGVPSRRTPCRTARSQSASVYAAVTPPRVMFGAASRAKGKPSIIVWPARVGVWHPVHPYRVASAFPRVWDAESVGVATALPATSYRFPSLDELTTYDTSTTSKIRPTRPPTIRRAILVPFRMPLSQKNEVATTVQSDVGDVNTLLR